MKRRSISGSRGEEASIVFNNGGIGKEDKVDEQYKRYTGEISRESRAKVEDKLDEPEEKRALILNCQRMTTNIRSRAIIHRRAHLLLKQRILLRYEN